MITQDEFIIGKSRLTARVQKNEGINKTRHRVTLYIFDVVLNPFRVHLLFSNEKARRNE